ncbi:EAL and modified HD-GYP domain-containing signal transduction protein [Allopseudospirillum japonicum]|uniref:EAL and modified HD-GYP domain-containing signal transduction protein n=1 Tax=Allopseudospirillum japonicum TaxID=64971 RepID=A0A1H6S6K3_9GAMM|nr:HDOD domain-containing protein [Allopseudospirillum japonicum]SEI60437.1 EAL and modified HD-GYP domain-containing signal transduction protein [Allopseudospirillum japonicum]
MGIGIFDLDYMETLPVTQNGGYTVARQPICDRDLRLCAYEILYRNAPLDEYAQIDNPVQATARVCSAAFFQIGLDQLAGALPVFINMTPEWLLSPDLLPRPQHQVVIEILEDIKPTPVLLDSLKVIRKMGYKLALDDFEPTAENMAFVALVDYIKLDVRACSMEELGARVRKFQGLPLKLLAEKVETWQEFEACKALGFHLFQGYFFARPETMGSGQIQENRTALMRILAVLHQAEPDLAELESYILQDPSLYYLILRRINSAYYSLPREVTSIRQALIYLGTDALKLLVSTLVLSQHSRLSGVLLPLALSRAKMCELIAESLKVPDSESYFTVGLLSLLDALLERPLVDLLESLPLAKPIKQALLEHSGPRGEVLSWVIAYEKADWEMLIKLPLTTEIFVERYIEATEWAENLLVGIKR